MSKKKILIMICALILAFTSVFATVAIAGNENEPALRIKSFALNLGDGVHIKVVAERTNIPKDVKLQLLAWNSPQSNYTIDCENEPEIFNAYSVDENGKTTFYHNKVSAKEMTDDFYFVVCANYGGEYVYSPVQKYSVLQYAYPKTVEGSTSELKPLLTAMLEYGAEAQLHFGYKTERLANDTYYQIIVTNGSLPDGQRKALLLATDTTVIKADAPAENKVFSSWKDADGVIVSTEETLTIENPTKDMSFTANYTDKGHVHNYELTTIPPTCIDDGYDLYKCEGCGDYYTTNPTSATGHTLGEWYLAENVTAKADGVMRLDCINCAYHQTKSVEIIDSGNFGDAGKANADTLPSDTATYTIFADGTLRVQGEGTLYNCNWNGEYQPFKSHRALITKVIVCEGITATSGGNFAKLHNLESFELPSTLTTLNNNAFWASLKKEITSITIPATVTYLGTYVFGEAHIKVDYPSARLIDIIIENPNTTFYSSSNWKCMFNSGVCNDLIKLYSYGENSTVKAFAESLGATYIDLDKVVSGTENNVNYSYFEGALDFTVADPELDAELPASMPWLNKIDKSDVKTINIGEGITAIPDGYFSDYTSLSSITVANSVNSIGNMAFSTASANSSALNLNFPENVSVLGSDIFKNRSNVYVEAFKTDVTKSFEEAGVNVHLRTAFRLLMIGNSLSSDGADYTTHSTRSMLYDILKAMLGEDSYVEVGVLYSGARTAAWHASVAEEGAAEYSFEYISDDTDGLWRITNGCSTREGLEYTNWNYVTIQPYGNEARTGMDNATTGTSSTSVTKKEKFYSLSASLPFLLDYINDYAPHADVYYYLTWSNTQDTSSLNNGASYYEEMIVNAITSSAYTGTESDTPFAGVIPGGTAIQNARSTYLAFLRCDDTSDPHYGLQRDNVHLNKHTARYAVALTIANILVPEEDRASNYTLPAVYDSPVVGKLPAEYTLIAQKAADLAAESATKEGNAKYRPIAIEGYTIDPADKLAEIIKAADFTNIAASTEASVINAIKAMAMEHAEAEVEVSVAIVPDSFVDGNFSAEITIKFGYTTRIVTIDGTLK